MHPYYGYWIVLETRQGGGLPDTVHGPFWDRAEADAASDLLVAEAKSVGREDKYVVAYADVDFDEN